MDIRTAGKDDAGPIALIHAQNWRIAYRGILSDEILARGLDHEDFWIQRFEKPKKNQTVFVAEDNGELLGFICAFGNEDGKWGTFIEGIHVHKDRKRQGIGKRLMYKAAFWADENYKGTGLYLNVLEHNIDARRFYEALGGQNRGSSPLKLPDGSEVKLIRYVWPYSAPILSTCMGRQIQI